MYDLHLNELDLIYALQKGGTPFWNQFFGFFNFFDTHYFYLLLILVIWIIFGWKTGFKILFLLLISAFINDFAKIIFQLPRPFMLDPKAALLFTVDGFGFPSGGAQNALLFALVFAHHLKKWWGYLIAFIYIVLIAFSRIYLGLHFFSDIAGGLVLGYGLFLAYLYLFPKIENFLKKHSLLVGLFLAQVVAFLMNFLNSSPSGTELALNFSLASLLCFVGLKFNFLPQESHNHQIHKIETKRRIIVSLLGILAISLFCLFWPCRFFVSSSLLVLWLVFGVGIFCRRK